MVTSMHSLEILILLKSFLINLTLFEFEFSHGNCWTLSPLTVSGFQSHIVNFDFFLTHI